MIRIYFFFFLDQFHILQFSVVYILMTVNSKLFVITNNNNNDSKVLIEY